MELIEKLHALVECGNDDYFNDGVYASMGVVEQHSDWISVDERLPEHGGTYPALADGRFGIAKFDPEYNAWLFKNFEVYELMANVTHWMPIPQPPK